jgi:NADH dehydrogenase FAD-containing subunit
VTKSEYIKSVNRSAPLVLAGAGHAHLVAMRQWFDLGWRPPAGSVMISSDTCAWYSGMMPGLIAGRFTLDECAIELAPLCQQLGMELIQADILAMDCDKQLLDLSTRAVIHYARLSINTGSRPSMPEHNDNSVLLVPAKPFPEFIAQWKNWQQSPPVSLMVLGGGAAAFELAMAINKRFRQTAVSLVCSGSLLGSLAPACQRLAQRYLMAADIKLIEHCRIDTIASDSAWSADKKILSPDAVVLATGASAHSWYRASGLDCDDDGFILVNECLCALNDSAVFVSGDAASALGSHRSGVFSVRHGPVLAHNIKAALENTPLRSYQPQSSALALLATANGGALMSYGRFGLGGSFTAPLLGRWKDYLDLSFMKRHRFARIR